MSTNKSTRTKAQPTKIVNVRFTFAEYATLEGLAQALTGGNLSEYIRQRALAFGAGKKPDRKLKKHEC